MHFILKEGMWTRLRGEVFEILIAKAVSHMYP